METIKLGVKGLFQFNRTPTAIAQEPEYLASLGLIQDLYRSTEYWHGTGRYKYTENRDTVDILGGIGREGGLIPHEDDWDEKRGVVNTVSLARSRMYARLYAGMFSPGGRPIENELGSREMWGAYFFGTSGVRVVLDNLRVLTRRGMQEARDVYRDKLDRWGNKISGESSVRSFVETFLDGTDIQENYPILIGIKRNMGLHTQGSRFIDLHEGRAEHPILLDGITHLEVPRGRVAETGALLQGMGHSEISVLPIEYGEEYCRRFTFRTLVSGKPLES